MTSYYFTAHSDDAAAEAGRQQSTDGEAFTSALDADSPALGRLVELVVGGDGASFDPSTQLVRVEGGGLVRLVTELRDTIADLDADAFGDLAGPWSDDAALPTDDDFVAGDFLTNLQHLARQSRAAGTDVYGTAS